MVTPVPVCGIFSLIVAIFPGIVVLLIVIMIPRCLSLWATMTTASGRVS